MDIKLSEKQQEALDSPTRFTVFGAGRRSGKTRLMAVWLFIQAMLPIRDGITLAPNSRILYVAPTLGMADDLMTELFGFIAEDYIKDFNVRKLEFTMVNGRKVKLAGCDKPRSLLGGSILALGMDEVQEIDINRVWNRVLRPACGDLKAPVLFSGTPLPGSSEDWHDLYKMGNSDAHPDWNSIHCNSTDNPFIDMQAEIDQARKDGVSEALIQQEFYASFEMTSSSHFEVDNLHTYTEIPKDVQTYIAVDPHGFGELEGLTLSQIDRLDEAAIAVVSVCPENKWYIRTIHHGRWSINDTAVEIARLCKEYQPRVLGIEKGALAAAMKGYLNQELQKLGVFPNIVPLSHGNKKKTDRIFWALQGRFERGMILFPERRPKWQAKLIKQLISIPSKVVHDDLADSLAYIDQLATPVIPQEVYDKWGFDDPQPFQPLDDILGF